MRGQRDPGDHHPPHHDGWRATTSSLSRRALYDILLRISKHHTIQFHLPCDPINSPHRDHPILIHLCFIISPLAPKCSASTIRIPAWLLDRDRYCLIPFSSMIVSIRRNMRSPYSLSFIATVLAAVSGTYSLPTIDSGRSTSSSTTELVADDGREPPQFAHLHKRKAAIHELEKRQQVNCTDPNAFFFSECWDILNIKDYLENPETGWIHTTRICQDSGGRNEDNNGANCCRDGEAWSTCYLRLAIPGSAHDCTSTSVDRCDAAMIQGINVHPSIRPYVRYTVKNIFGTALCCSIIS